MSICEGLFIEVLLCARCFGVGLYNMALLLSISMKRICNAVSFWLLACTQVKTLFLEMGVLSRYTATSVLIYLSVISALAVYS